MDALKQYLIVRRDLPLGVLCAQLAHAAGESFFLLHNVLNSDVAQWSRASGDLHSLPEGGGSNPSIGAILRRGSSEKERLHGLRIEQEVGGLIPPPGSIPFQFDSSRTIVVVLGVRSEAKLLTLEQKLEDIGVVHYVAVREPDAPWNNQLMAIGIMPIAQSWAKLLHDDVLKDFQVLDERTYRVGEREACPRCGVGHHFSIPCNSDVGR